WRDMLPDWNFRFWGNDNLDLSSRYLREAFAVRAWNRVSDYMRMTALRQFGGVYLDTDVELLRSLEPLLDCDAFLGFQNVGDTAHEMVNAAVFGTEPGHWLPCAIRKHFDEKQKGWLDVGAFSGPGLITKVLRDHGLHAYSDEAIEIQGVRIY